MPRTTVRLVACAACGEVRPLHTARLCTRCYQRSRAGGARPRRCARCDRLRVLYSRSLCRRCWDHDHDDRYDYATPDPPGPSHCPDCGEWFASMLVREAHVYLLTGRCLTAAELQARGWRQSTSGWMFPAPPRPGVR